jgi:hypothetical protein
MGNIEIRQSIAELVHIVDSHRQKGDDSVKLSPPLGQELVALIDHKLVQGDRRSDPFPPPFPMGPSQVVERVYWEVGLKNFAAVIDAVRTVLVQLVVEARVTDVAFLDGERVDAEGGAAANR